MGEQYQQPETGRAPLRMSFSRSRWRVRVRPGAFGLILWALLTCNSSQCHDTTINANQDSPESLSPREYHLIWQHVCESRGARWSARPANTSSNASSSSPASANRQDYVHYLEELNRSDRFRRLDLFNCEREPTAWRWAYFHEPNSDLLVKEESLDERLANILYTTRSSKMFNIEFFRFNSGDRQLDAHNKKLVAGPQVNDELCGEQLGQIVQLQAQLRDKLELKRENPSLSAGLAEEHIRVAQLLDSYGRYESGFLAGRFHSMGSYEQCLGTRLKLGGSSRVATRYCWASLSLDKHLDPWTLRKRNATIFEYPDNSISVGICVPQACHSRSFELNRDLFQRIVSSQFKLPASVYLDETLELESVFCLVDEGSQFAMPLAGKIWLVGCLGWLLLTVYATIRARRRRHDYLAPAQDSQLELAPPVTLAAAGKTQLEPPAPTLLDNLNLAASWNEFMMLDKPAPSAQATASRRIELDALNLFKIMLCPLVVLGHSMCFNLGYAMDEPSVHQKLESDPVVVGMFVATLVVDTFFVITGLLMTFFTLNILTKMASKEKTPAADDDNNNANLVAPPGVAPKSSRRVAPARLTFQPVQFGQQWLAVSVARYARIVPLFALVYWFKRFVYVYLGSGPYWDHGFNRLTKHGACLREPWYTPLTFLTAFYPLSSQCLLQSWSISNDLFFGLFAPPLILLLLIKPRLASLAAALAFLASALLSYRMVLLVEPQLDWEARDLRPYGIVRIYNLFSYLYTQPQFRVPSFLAGVLAGYLLHLYNKRGGQQHWPRPLRGPISWLAWLTCCFIVVASVTQPYWRDLSHPHYRHFYVHLLTTFRYCWAFGNAILFLRLMTDLRGGRFVRFSAAKCWKIYCRLQYAILLLHLDIILYNYQSSTSTFLFSRWQTLVFGLATYLLCVPLSVLVHVVFENPIDKLTRSVLFERAMRARA